MPNTNYNKEEWDQISEKLSQQLGPEFLAQRPGPSGRPLTYIEGKTAITIANDIFGFNGWSSEIKDTTVDYVDVGQDNRYSIGISVTIRITLKDGSFHEDIGYGTDSNSKSKGSAFEKARKQAVTDATKRTLRCFGNALGNCLYDNPYLNGIGKMAKPTIKFSPKNLYRHSQFNAPKIEPTKPADITNTSNPNPPLPNSNPVRQLPQPVTKPTFSASTANSVSTATPVSTPTPLPSKSVPITQTLKEESLSDYNIIKEAENQGLFEPIVPEDSFTYEGDEEFLVEMLAKDDEAMFADDGDEMLAGIITPPPQTVSYSSAPGPQSGERREAPLSDRDEHLSKKLRTHGM